MYVMGLYISIVLIRVNIITQCLLIGVFYKGTNICVKFGTIINYFKYMIKCMKHGKIHIICCITLDQYHPSGPRDDTAYDTDFAMYYSLCTDDKLPVTICKIWYDN
jgi:hypothetical protein